LQIYAIYSNIESRKLRKGVIELAKAEATVRPAEVKTETVAEITVADDKVKIVFPEKRDDFRLLVKGLGYIWTGVWERKIYWQNGTPADRAAEAGHNLLAAGFIVRIYDSATRQMAIDGSYEPEQKRWIYYRMDGKYEGWFAIHWQRPDDFYAVARKLPGSRWDRPFVVVPPEQFEQVLGFAETYEFSLTDKAQGIADEARAAKEAMLIVNVEPKMERAAAKPGIKPPVLETPERVEVDESLRDDD